MTGERRNSRGIALRRRENFTFRIRVNTVTSALSLSFKFPLSGLYLLLLAFSCYVLLITVFASKRFVSSRDRDHMDFGTKSSQSQSCIAMMSGQEKSSWMELACRCDMKIEKFRRQRARLDGQRNILTGRRKTGGFYHPAS
jgi:hypothetical protein